MNIEQTQAGVIGMAWDRGTSDAVLGRGYSNRYMHNGLKKAYAAGFISGVLRVQSIKRSIVTLLKQAI